MERPVRFFSEGVPITGVVHLPEARGPRPAVIINHGLSGLKEMWAPEIATALAAAGHVALRFDYRHFGESGGEPRGRQVPLSQVTDVRNAVTYLETLGEVDASRIGVFGLAAGGAIAMYAGAVDSRIRCLTVLEAPADCERVFRRTPYDQIMARAREAKRRFVETGEAETMSWAELWREIDPGVDDSVAAMAARFPGWTSEISTESFVDFFSFCPEAVVDRISPRAICWIHAREDDRVPLAEAESAYAKAGEPKKLVVLEGGHSIYFSTALSDVIAEALGWFDEHL